MGGALAGLGAAGKALVRRLVARYALLALGALLLAPLWSRFGAPPAAPSMLPSAFWQAFVGRIDGRSCPSYPVCSAYAREAIRRHGLLIGSWLALDRLIHEGGDLARGPRIRIDGVPRLYDPLQRNDFWLEGR